MNSQRERFQVELTGKIDDRFELRQVVENFAALLKRPPKNVAPLFDGKRRTLKAGVDLKAAKKYLKAATECGAGCELKVMLDGRCLREATFSTESLQVKKARALFEETKGGDVEEERTKAADIKEDSSKHAPVFFGFDKARLFPVVFHPPCEEELLDKDRRAVGRISSQESAVGTPFAFFVALAVGFFLEFRFSYYFAENFSTGISATILSLGIFALIVVFVPNLIRPSKKMAMKIETEEGPVSLRCVQKNARLGLARSFLLKDESDTPLAIMCREKLGGRYICSDFGGNLLFSAEEEPDLDELLFDTARSIGDEIIDLSYVDQARNYLKKFAAHMKRTLKPRRGRRKPSLQTSDISAASSRQKLEAILETMQNIEYSGSEKVLVVRSAAGNALGHFVVSRHCGLVLYPDETENIDRRALLGFGLMLGGM